MLSLAHSLSECLWWWCVLLFFENSWWQDLGLSDLVTWSSCISLQWKILILRMLPSYFNTNFWHLMSARKLRLNVLGVGIELVRIKCIAQSHIRINWSYTLKLGLGYFRYWRFSGRWLRFLLSFFFNLFRCFSDFLLSIFHFFFMFLNHLLFHQQISFLLPYFWVFFW